VGKGKAKVTLSYDAWKEGRVAPATVEMRVIAPEDAKGAGQSP
jgi:hypothetical protein